MKLYLFETEEGKYLAEMKGVDPREIKLGAVTPGLDADYYKDLVVATQYVREGVLGAVGWLAWVKEALSRKTYVFVDEEFPFDVLKVKIVTFEKVEGQE